MALMGKVEVRLDMHESVRALAAIRDATILWRIGQETELLRQIHDLAAEALAKAELADDVCPDHIASVI